MKRNIRLGYLSSLVKTRVRKRASDMGLTMKGVMRDATPPFLWRMLRGFRTILLNYHGSEPKRPEYEYIPQGWTYLEDHPSIKGWNVPDVLEVYKRKWPIFGAMTEGTSPLGVAHESDLGTNTDLATHNTIMSFAYALALAARHKDCLSMLDWGGGIGHYYLLAEALLPQARIQYHCKDVPLLTGYGAKVLPGQYFYSDDSCLERTYDFVMASGSLHYAQDWHDLLGRLASATDGYLLVTRLPMVVKAPSFVFVQRPYAYGYNTEFLGWCLNRKEFLEFASNLGLRLYREFVVAERPRIGRAPAQCQLMGFLFRSPFRSTS